MLVMRVNGSLLMIIPMRAPFNPTMNVSTTVLNVPGLEPLNTDGKVTVDSRSPTVLFEQMSYPDSSLTVLESDLPEEVLVSLTTVDEIGMPDEDLEARLDSPKDNQPVAGTEATVEPRLAIGGRRKSSFPRPT